MFTRLYTSEVSPMSASGVNGIMSESRRLPINVPYMITGFSSFNTAVTSDNMVKILSEQQFLIDGSRFFHNFEHSPVIEQEIL